MSSPPQDEAAEGWTIDNCRTKHFDSNLRFRNMSIESLADPQHWRKVCPFMNSMASKAQSQEELEILLEREHRCSDEVGNNSKQLRERGYFCVDSLTKSEIVNRTAMAVFHLIEYGYPPTMCLMYDESWILGALIGSVCEGSCANGAGIGDWYVFVVDPQRGHPYKPGPPHRDRPAADGSSFRGDESPKYCSVWMALTDATPDNSCLYFVPKACDKGYHGKGDAIPTALAWQDIVAQPLSAGGMLAFSHRLLHWGSKQQEHKKYVPRVALTLAYADSTFEGEYFDHSLLPFPPAGLRLGLVAGQQIQYEHLSPLDRTLIGLYRRIFFKHVHHFWEVYAEKISSAVQFLDFQLKRTASNQTKAAQQRNQKPVAKNTANLASLTFLDDDIDEEDCFASLFE